eukprot:scaffold37788_cov132-Skeletonema_marinoi.AAC.1
MFLPKSFIYYSYVGSCRNIWSQLVIIAHHRIEGTSSTPELRFTQSIRGPEGRLLSALAPCPLFVLRATSLLKDFLEFQHNAQRSHTKNNHVVMACSVRLKGNAGS